MWSPWQLTDKCSTHVFLTPPLIWMRNTRRKSAGRLGAIARDSRQERYASRTNESNSWMFHPPLYVRERSDLSRSRCPIHNSKCSQEDQYKFGWVIKELRDLKQINDKNGQSSSRCDWFGVWGRFLQTTGSICKIYTNPYTYHLQININRQGHAFICYKQEHIIICTQKKNKKGGRSTMKNGFHLIICFILPCITYLSSLSNLISLCKIKRKNTSNN